MCYCQQKLVIFLYKLEAFVFRAYDQCSGRILSCTDLWTHGMANLADRFKIIQAF